MGIKCYFCGSEDVVAQRNYIVKLTDNFCSSEFADVFVCKNHVIKTITTKEKEEMINATIAIQKETGVNLFPYKCEKISVQGENKK